MPRKKSNVDEWLKRESPHTRKALENASRHFDDQDSLTVNVLEGLYGQESSFGAKRKKRHIVGAAGDFQLEKNTASRVGLAVTKDNDQRFDIDDASAAAAKYLKIIDDSFGNQTALSENIKTIPIPNSNERLKFTVAAYNAGEGRIARAQMKAKADGKNPEQWNDVKKYLEAAGASTKKSEEIQNYVEEVLAYSEEFSKKSKADKMARDRRPEKIENFPKGGHWITKDGRHILIRYK